MSSNEEPPDLPAEIVYGVKAIASLLNEKNERRVYYMLEKGFVPGAWRCGQRSWAVSVPAFRRAVHGEAT